MPPEVPRVRPSVEHVQIDDESLVFDGENLHRLTGAAHLVLMAVDGISTSEHIAAELATRHRTDLDRVRGDVEATLAELTERDLVELIAAPSSPAYRIPDHVAHTFDDGTVHVANL